MGKDDSTWLRIAYVAFFILIAYVGFSAARMIGIQLGYIERFEFWDPYVQWVVGLIVGGSLTFYLRSDKQRNEYYLASIAELRKVTWPSWPDVKRMTIIVCVVVAFFAVVLGVFDFLWAGALAQIMT